MKYSVFVIFLFTGHLVSGQKIISDQKDAFTGARQIVTSMVPALSIGGTAGIEIGGYLELSDTVQKINIFVSSFKADYAVSSDSVKRECLIKLEDGKILTGIWVSTTDLQGTAYTKSGQISTYKFTKQDIDLMTTVKVTDIKVVGSNNHRLQFSVSPSKNQNKIKDLATLLLKYL